MARKRKNNLTEAKRRLNETVVQVYTSEGMVGEFGIDVFADGETGAVRASTDSSIGALWWLLLWTILRDTQQSRIERDIHRAAAWNVRGKIPEEGQLELPIDEDLAGGFAPQDDTEPPF